MKFFVYLAILLLPLSLLAAPKYPFPTNAAYPFGIKPANVDPDRIQRAYLNFIQRFYEESGDKARIKWDNSSQTVSEGIGYGMLIMVYMDNEANKTQGKFDKLWKYYNSFLNDNKLMHWRIDGFSGVADKNAATDAELDVAVALMEAYKQWGNESYLNDAKSLIEKIWKHEVNERQYLKPGDAWDSKKNPSYFSTAALELFKNGGSQDWSKVISNSYSLLKKVANSSSGLVPDWCSEDGNPLGNYQYDAARTPWRLAWGYVWYGHSDAKTLCSKIASWANSSTNGDPAKIVDGYELNGNKSGRIHNSTFLGALACAGMVDATHQKWLDDAYNQQVALVKVDESYFNESLKVIYLLLLSGNMPNFWGKVPVKYQDVSPVNTPSLSLEIAPKVSSQTVDYSVANPGHISINLYNTSGKKIATLLNTYFTGGTSSVRINKLLSNGTYWIELNSVTGKLVKKLTINK